MKTRATGSATGTRAAGGFTGALLLIMAALACPLLAQESPLSPEAAGGSSPSQTLQEARNSLAAGDPYSAWALLTDAHSMDPAALGGAGDLIKQAYNEMVERARQDLASGDPERMHTAQQGLAPTEDTTTGEVLRIAYPTTTVQRVAELKALRGEALTLVGTELLDSGNPSEAIELLRRAVEKLRPGDEWYGEAVFLLGRSYVSLGDQLRESDEVASKQAYQDSVRLLTLASGPAGGPEISASAQELLASVRATLDEMQSVSVLPTPVPTPAPPMPTTAQTSDAQPADTTARPQRGRLTEGLSILFGTVLPASIDPYDAVTLFYVLIVFAILFWVVPKLLLRIIGKKRPVAALWATKTSFLGPVAMIGWIVEEARGAPKSDAKADSDDQSAGEPPAGPSQ